MYEVDSGTLFSRASKSDCLAKGQRSYVYDTDRKSGGKVNQIKSNQSHSPRKSFTSPKPGLDSTLHDYLH